MEKPEYCPKAMYDMMLKAWDADPIKRPNFLELMDELGDLLEDGERDHYLNLTKNFDASTVGNFVNTVENRNYFGMMAAPDFMSQMSVTPAQVSPEDGYLIPSAKKEQSFQFDEKDLSIPADRGQSLKLIREQSLKLDTDDYLMPNGKSPNEIELTSFVGVTGNATTAV